MKEINLKDTIRTIPHFPKKGIMFRDITTLLKNPDAMNQLTKIFTNRYKNKGINKVVGVESRGFIFGAIIAHEIHAGFIPARKPGKLPAKTTKVEYELEYGKDALEMHNDAIDKGDKVLIVDDLCATGGTLKATAELVEKLGGKIEEIAYVIDLPELKGKEKLKNYKTFNLIEFEGE